MYGTHEPWVEGMINFQKRNWRKIQMNKENENIRSCSLILRKGVHERFREEENAL